MSETDLSHARVAIVREKEMQISVCLDTVFRGHDVVSSLELLRETGAKAFEFWRWWDMDLEHLCQAKEQFGLTAVACCTRFVSLVDADKRAEYLAGLRDSIQAAKRIGCPLLISQIGKETGLPFDEQKRNVIEGLKACVPLLEVEGITLVIEPINTIEIPRYFLSRSTDAFDIVQAVGSPNVKVLFDIYHQQITEGNLIQRITENIQHIGHFHAAGNPGRHELYYGEINYGEVLRAIQATGYTGYVGLEYFPLDEPRKGIRELLNNQQLFPG